MIREILARLTARGVEYDRLAAGSIRPENLAYLLSGLQDGPLYLAQWLDLDVPQARHKLWAVLMLRLPEDEFIQKWDKHDGTVKRLLDIAMIEISKTSLCKSCNGEGSKVQDGGEIETCKTCGGTGHKGIMHKIRRKCSG